MSGCFSCLWQGFSPCISIDTQHFVKYFTILGKKVSKIFGIGGKNALSLHPLSEGGTPAVRDGGEGASREGGAGVGEWQGKGTWNQPVFQQFRKKFEKICGKIWRERIKTFIFASAFARKNRLTMSD